MSLRTLSSRSSRLHETAKQWARDFKIPKSLLPIPNLDQIFEIWCRWMDGERQIGNIGLADLDDDLHGVTRVRRGKVMDIRISRADRPKRQQITLVHELLHAAYHPNQPETDEEHNWLHVLAGGLATTVFPAVRNNLYYLTDDEAAYLEDGVSDLFEDGELDIIPIHDSDLLAKRGQGRGFSFAKGGRFGMQNRGIPSVLERRKANAIQLNKRQGIRAIKAPGAAADPIVAQYNGWLTPVLMNLFRAQSFIIPIRGIDKVTPLSNFQGFRPQTFDSLMAQIVQTLEAGSDRTVKAYASAIAAAAAATTINALSATYRGIGLLCTLSDSVTSADSRPFPVDHFYNAGTQTQHLIHPDLSKGPCQWVALHVENDRGAGVVTARTDLSIRIPADKVRAGAVLTVESLNSRDLFL